MEPTSDAGSFNRAFFVHWVLKQEPQGSGNASQEAPTTTRKRFVAGGRHTKDEAAHTAFFASVG